MDASRMDPQTYQKWISELEERSQKAQSRWWQIYQRGIGETHELQSQHKKLIAEARAALEKLTQFEVNELGMQTRDYQARKEMTAEELAK